MRRHTPIATGVLIAIAVVILQTLLVPLFAGPAVSPRWEPTYVPESIVSPITALWVNEGRLTAGLAQRAKDPSLAAARRFAALEEGDDLEDAA